MTRLWARLTRWATLQPDWLACLDEEPHQGSKAAVSTGRYSGDSKWDATFHPSDGPTT